MDKNYFQFAPIEETKDRVFITRLMIQRSVCRNGNLSLHDIFDDLWIVIGDDKHPSRLNQSLHYLADRGFTTTRRYRKMLNDFYLDGKNLPMLAESYYDAVMLVNIKEFVKKCGFDNDSNKTAQHLLENLDKLEQIVLSGEGISHRIDKGFKTDNPHTTIDNNIIKYFGVNFRAMDDSRNNMWDDIASKYPDDARTKFVEVYKANGVDVSGEDSDYDINLKCMDYMLDSLAQTCEQKKDKMSLNAAKRYIQKTEFVEHTSTTSPEEMYRYLKM